MSVFKKNSKDSIFTPLAHIMSIQAAITTADGMASAPKGDHAYRKALGKFKQAEKAHVSSIVLEILNAEQTRMIVTITSAQGVENPHEYIATRLTMDNATKTGGSIAMIINTKRQSATACGIELTKFAQRAGDGDQIEFKLVGSAIKAEVTMAPKGEEQ